MYKSVVNINEKHAKRDLIDLVCITLPLIILFLMIIAVCIIHNTNSDNFFLITTGKYIVNNRSVPTTNIWTIHEDFKMVVQQWICCVENYIAYNLGQNLGIVILAIIHAVILNVILIKFIGLYNKKITIPALYISDWLVIKFMNARPSLVTISILTYELIQLEKWNRSPKDKKSNIKLLINLVFISLFHINYHAALWFMDILFILPYMVPAIWELDIHNLKKSLFTQENKRDLKMLTVSMPIIFISALINPNGINAVKYLFNSTQMFDIWDIDELIPWRINEINSIIIITVIVALIIYIIKGGRDKTLIYLTSGTIILSMMYTRNIWMIMFSIIRLLAVYNSKKEMHKVSTATNTIITSLNIVITISLMIFIQSSLSTVQITYDKLYIPVKAVEYLDSLPQEEKENLVLYNEFGNGAYLELHGYKAYIDARPEIYQKSINGKADIYQEWVNLRYGLTDIPTFINKYHFNTFIVENGTTLHCYLHYNNDYERVLNGNGYTVYRKSA